MSLGARRSSNRLTTTLVAMALVLGSAASHARKSKCRPGSLTGKVTHVRDGDTIEIGPMALRLQGLHAPEKSEARGKQADKFMRRLVMGRRLVCRLDGTETHDRCVAVCRLIGEDIAIPLIRAGLGRGCPRFSRGRYRAHETAAGRRLPLPDYCLRR